MLDPYDQAVSDLFWATSVGLNENSIKITRTSSPAEIYADLKAKGYRVVAVNPGRATVDGDEAFRSVADLPEPPDIVNIVVPPPRTLQVLDDVAELEDAAVWIQPGAADKAVRDRVAELGIPALIDACIMVHARVKP